MPSERAIEGGCAGFETEGLDRPHSQGRGLHRHFKVAEEGVKKVIKIYLKYATATLP